MSGMKNSGGCRRAARNRFLSGAATARRSTFPACAMIAKPRLSARVFYGVIVAGVLLGIAGCVAAGWAYLLSGGRKPTGRRIWDADAESFVIPICVMVGATFGGMAGVLAAVVWDRRTSSSRRSRVEDRAGE